MNGTLTSWLYKLAGIFVSVFFVCLAVRQVDLSESLRTLTDVRLAVLVAAIFTYLSSFPIRGLRWRLILRAQKALSLGEIMTPVFVGYMANNVLPARTGEIYRAHYLGRYVQMSRSGVAASIVVERTFDGLMLVCVILAVFVLFPQAHFLGSASLVVALAFLALAMGVLFYGLATNRVHKMIDWVLGLLPASLGEPIVLRLDFFLRGIRGISTAKEFSAVSGYTIIVWLLEACAIALVVASFQISLPLAGFVLVFALAALTNYLKKDKRCRRRNHNKMQATLTNPR